MFGGSSTRCIEFVLIGTLHSVAMAQPQDGCGHVAEAFARTASASSEAPVLDTRSPIGRAAQSAVEQLARHLAVDVAAITVLRAEEVDWPDGSLGCPLPGMRYRQALVNGSFVQLRAGDRLYNYHGAGSRPPKLCLSRDEVLPEQLQRKPGGGDLRI